MNTSVVIVVVLNRHGGRDIISFTEVAQVNKESEEVYLNRDTTLNHDRAIARSPYRSKNSDISIATCKPTQHC